MVDPPFPPRLDLARLQTPIVRLDRLSKAWSGPTLWVKRDDQTGALLTGNKIRKLQYAVREALDHGADTLITCGGLQSNHCRATAAVARRMNLDVVLVLRGEQPERSEGNYFLDRLLGAEIVFVTADQYADKERVMDEIADDLRARGKRPYVVAEGCSMPIGCWGYVECAHEIADAERDLGVHFDAIVHAVGSGGTSAGLEIGVRMTSLGARVIGIPVCDDAAHFRRVVAGLCEQTIERFDLDIEIDDGAIELVDGYVGDGYGRTRPEERTTLIEIARSEGIVLDPVYGGKAMHGLRYEIQAGRLADCSNILFVHTGGIFGLFPHADAFIGA